MPLFGCLIPSRLINSENRSRSSARSMLSGEVPMIGTPARLQRQRELERSLPAELNDHAVGLFPIDDIHHFFEGQRLEVKLIGGIVIGAHGLRIAIDHDRFVALFAQGKRRMHAAVVELDALADAVWPAAENHDLLSRRRLRLVLAFISRIQIRRERLKLGAAGIDGIENRLHSLALSARCEFSFSSLPISLAMRASAKPICFQAPQDSSASSCAGLPAWLRRSPHPSRRFRESFRETTDRWPRADKSRRRTCRVGNASPKYQSRWALGCLSFCRTTSNDESRLSCGQIDLGFETEGAGFQRTHGLLQRFIECPPDRHRLAHRFHLRR